MKKLQTELTDLEKKVQKIHRKLPQNHQFWRTCKIAEFRRQSPEEIERSNFIMRDFKSQSQYEDKFKADSESWESDSDENFYDADSPKKSQAKENLNEKNDLGGLSQNLGNQHESSEIVKEPICFLFRKQMHKLYNLQNLMDQTNCKYFDVQKPWTLYWSLNSLSAINEIDILGEIDRRNMIKHVLTFQNLESGAFSGGTHYHSNIISSYAAVLALAILDRPELCREINRPQFLDFLMSMKVYLSPESVIRRRVSASIDNKGPMCSFKLSSNGEVDIRNIYTAIVCHDLLQLGAKATLFQGCVEYILACQTFEGGLGPHPGREAHGGYTYCGVAALSALDSLHLLDMPKLLRWLTNRQMYYEGGFSGRTNKIVDSCYTFWQGATFNIIFEYFQHKPQYRNFLYEPYNLYKYLLLCCQARTGGMKDKPSKGEDPYHTMYALIGLALSVNLVRKVGNSYELKEDWPESVFAEMDPIFSIPKKFVARFKEFWRNEDKNKL